MSVNIFAASKEIAKELELVACWACAGDDAFSLRPFVERFASFLPFFERSVTNVCAVVADDDLPLWVGGVANDFVEFELR